MRKFNVIAGILGLGLGFAAAAPAAHAASFIPQQEGEIKLTNLETLDPNQTISTSGLGFSVTSLEFDDAEAPEIEYGLSRLFVDDAATANNYGDGFIKFSSAGNDAGTNAGAGEFWLRAAAIQKNGVASEGGRLEVGRFLFEFERELEEITIDFFDVESLGSGILQVNGQSVTDKILADGLGDGNTQSLTLNNVNSLVLQLGNTNGSGSGDGVLISGVEAVKSVPEPTTTFSLGALAVAGMFGVKKRKNLKK
ncbi:PEP-CTERM putative exosortase interaction domain-containing protein [Rivularia sp. PCC 7116]|uniref:LEVG family PEP-CTERM protein n=1 Tax=Rivularia sp. PCC 7116 TaxID=373994 RepID=UPI00029F2D23|nr:LEVG family PEP-CTERM protein [Rivularia sp. PCC 7116]AFY54900.1 PEP-CTERM putative exosortase interaction domain-containing protein [Rivularia sp. PCC 7116]